MIAYNNEDKSNILVWLIVALTLTLFIIFGINVYAAFKINQSIDNSINHIQKQINTNVPNIGYKRHEV